MKREGILNRILKAIALAMGVAVVVLSIWQVADATTLIAMLGIGLLAAAIVIF